MKTIYCTVIFLFSFFYNFSQDTCKTCDSLKKQSRHEYNYEAYSKYYKECIIRDTVFYGEDNVVAKKYDSNKYTIKEKDYCDTYFSDATYETLENKLINGYSIENNDSIYWAVPDQDLQMQKIIPVVINHISNNTIYPKKCRKSNIEGKVFLTFVLNEEGNPINVYAIKSPNQLLSIEAVRVIKSLKNITPLKYNGRPVKYKLNIPINFRLD